MQKYDNNIENSRNTRNTQINPYINQNNEVQNNNTSNVQNPLGGFSQGDFVKGALIGAAVTFLLTNKGAQEKIMNAAAKGSELFQAGMEELKERYEDARAQMDESGE